MNSAMRITINVVRQNAAALVNTANQVKAVGTAAKTTNAQLAGMSTASGRASRSVSSLSNFINVGTNHLTNFGKNLQWTGRQIEFRFTLPIVAAMTAATRWALANEEAMTRVRKVYGDGSESVEQLAQEMDALSQFTLALSNTFGVNREEVTKVAADWAAAGSAGAGLLRSLRLTLETAIAGDIDLAEATEGLIAIQSAYRLSTEQMRIAMAQLNAIENTTQVSTRDLIEVLSKTSGVGKQFGVEIRDIAAFSATLVRVVGSASEAGNALKTIMTRVMAPTNEAAEAFKAMGINLEGAFKNKNFEGRLGELAVAFQKLDDGQRAFAARTIASQWQINKFAELMDDVAAGPLGRYARAQAVLADENTTKNVAAFNREIITVLKSDPKVFARAWQQVRNELAELMLLVMPFFKAMLEALKRAVTWFSNLSNGTKKFILYGLMLLALFGPLISYLGATITLIGVLTGAFVKLTAAMLSNPWVALTVALIAVIALLVVYRKQVAEHLQGIIHSFEQFATIVVNVLKAMYRGVVAVVKLILEALSYLNPFARHSPSLVDNVRAGIATVLDEYENLKQISPMLRGVLADIDAFSNASAGIMLSAQAKKTADQRADLVSAGAGQDVLDAFDKMTASVAQLRGQLPVLKQQIGEQAIVVAKWSEELRKADLRLQAAEDGLDALSEAAAQAGRELDDARQVLADLSNTGILGEAAADQQIFDTEMAIKNLRLELLRLEEQGQGVDDLADRMARLTGEIEKLRALETSLRKAGAGSEILGPIRAQIAALEAQRRAAGTSGGGRVAEINKQIDALERQQQILELERSIKFDPLKRQLDILRNGIKELPFDELIERTRTQQALVATLTKRYDEANAAVEEQKKVVDALRKSRDEINRVYDTESNRLSQLEDAYRALEQAIQDAESAVTALSDAQRTAAGQSALGPGGDFGEPVGGTSLIGREGGIDDMLAELEKLQREMTSQLTAADPFKGLKERLESFKQGWREFWNDVEKFASEAAGRVTAIVGGVGSAFETTWNFIVEKTTAFWGSFTTAVQPLKDELAKWGELWEPFKNATEQLWSFIGPILKVLAANFALNFNLIAQIISDVWSTIYIGLKLVWDNIVNTAAAFLEILRGSIHIVLSLISGDWSGVWEGIKTVFSGALHFFQAQWDLVSGLFTKLIPDAVRSVGQVFNDLWGAAKTAAEKINEWFGNAYTWLTGWLDKMLGPIDEILGKLGKVKDILGGLGGGLDVRSEIIKAARQQGASDADINRILAERGYAGLAAGGIVMPRAGGSLFRLAEKGVPEAVIPLDGKHALGSTTIIINGNLEFPNIHSGSDADQLVRNLKVLAG